MSPAFLTAEEQKDNALRSLCPLHIEGASRTGGVRGDGPFSRAQEHQNQPLGTGRLLVPGESLSQPVLTMSRAPTSSTGPGKCQEQDAHLPPRAHSRAAWQDTSAGGRDTCCTPRDTRQPWLCSVGQGGRWHCPPADTRAPRGGSRLCTTELTCQELRWKGEECGVPRSLVLSIRAPWAWRDTPGHPSTLQLISSSTSSPQQPCTELGGSKGSDNDGNIPNEVRRPRASPPPR